MLTSNFPTLQSLPKSLPLNGAVQLELVEGALIFRASDQVQTRIEDLLEKQKDMGLTAIEEDELSSYEEIDDYLSFVNRTIAKLAMNRERVLSIREADREIGRHPPNGDRQLLQ